MVTVDADGQHHPDDVLEVAAKLRESDEECLVIGQRAFEKDVPLAQQGRQCPYPIRVLLSGRSLSSGYAVGFARTAYGVFAGIDTLSLVRPMITR